MKKKLSILFMILIFVFILIVFKSKNNVLYSDSENWAILPYDSNKDVDLFIICPTIDFGSNKRLNMNLSDKEMKANFVGALNMEIGIYSDFCNVYAPYYRQMTLAGYNKKNQKPYLDLAYKDIENAFIYYLEHYNKDRPFIIAGFSQGSQMGIRLLEELFDNPNYSKKLVSAYLIGWPVTESIISNYPWIKIAKSETDTGCIISFNSESPEINSSFTVPKGMKSFSINPLNWKVDSTFADSSKNIGACFTDYNGNIIKEIPFFTGAYLDKNRGTLKVTNVNPKEYPPILEGFSVGEYHVYDYQFFYRNLQKNVKKRINSYFNNIKAKKHLSILKINENIKC